MVSNMRPNPRLRTKSNTRLALAVVFCVGQPSRHRVGIVEGASRAMNNVFLDAMHQGRRRLVLNSGQVAKSVTQCIVRKL